MPLILITYLGLERISTDTGWGCTYRSSQMLLAEALMRQQQKSRSFFPFEGVQPSSYLHEERRRAILRMFQDSHDASAYFSIQRMAESASCFGKRPGEWISPSEAAVLLRCDSCS